VRHVIQALITESDDVGWLPTFTESADSARFAEIRHSVIDDGRSPVLGP